MNKVIAVIILAGCRVLWGAPITLSFSPSSQTVALGGSVSVDVVISGLGALKVGAFDLNTDFNPMILSPSGVRFGPLLGNPSLFEAFTGFSLLPSRVEFAESSLLSPADLNAQPASFTLASLQFNVIGSGTSALTFSQTVVDDPFGGKLIVSAGSGTITAVPEPSTCVLVVTALLALCLCRYHEKRIQILENWGCEQ